MQALLDFTLSSGQQWAAAVVFAFRFSDWEVLFPVWHAEAALAEAASVLWWVAEGRLGAGAAIFYGWIEFWKLLFFYSTLKIKNHFTSFYMQNVLQKGF